MKKILFLIIPFFVLACTPQNPPPQWWNPSGAYSNGDAAPKQAEAKTSAQPEAKVLFEAPALPEPQYEDNFTPVEDEDVEIVELSPSVLQ